MRRHVYVSIMIAVWSGHHDGPLTTQLDLKPKNNHYYKSINNEIQSINQYSFDNHKEPAKIANLLTSIICYQWRSFDSLTRYIGHVTRVVAKNQSQISDLPRADQQSVTCTPSQPMSVMLFVTWPSCANLDMHGRNFKTGNLCSIISDQSSSK
jgi:hypothetical protein